jgi:hypothetical protein
MTPETLKEHEERTFGPLTGVSGQEIKINQDGTGKMV